MDDVYASNKSLKFQTNLGILDGLPKTIWGETKTSHNTINFYATILNSYSDKCFNIFTFI